MFKMVKFSQFVGVAAVTILGLMIISKRVEGGGVSGFVDNFSGGGTGALINTHSPADYYSRSSPSLPRMRDVIPRDVPREIFIPKSMSRGEYAINKANPIGIVSIPKAGQAPSRIRIEAQSQVSRALGLPKTLYSTALPAMAARNMQIVRGAVVSKKIDSILRIKK
jgi:hypothetical protein